METRKGFKYIGEIPDVFVQAPLEMIDTSTYKCTGCNNILNTMPSSHDSVICPYCAAQEVTNETE